MTINLLDRCQKGQVRLVFLELVHQHNRASESDVLLAFQHEVNSEILRAFLLMAFFDFVSSDQDLFVQDLVEPKLLTIEDFFLREIPESFRHEQAPEIA